jgi:hypothetical protein
MSMWLTTKMSDWHCIKISHVEFHQNLINRLWYVHQKVYLWQGGLCYGSIWLKFEIANFYWVSNYKLKEKIYPMAYVLRLDRRWADRHDFHVMNSSLLCKERLKRSRCIDTSTFFIAKRTNNRRVGSKGSYRSDVEGPSKASTEY